MFPFLKFLLRSYEAGQTRIWDKTVDNDQSQDKRMFDIIRQTGGLYTHQATQAATFTYKRARP